MSVAAARLRRCACPYARLQVATYFEELCTKGERLKARDNDKTSIPHHLVRNWHARKVADELPKRHLTKNYRRTIFLTRSITRSIISFPTV